MPGGSRVLVALSGGADSVCLLHMLLEKKQELGIEVFAAHYEHGLRGEESLRDADFAAELCKSLGVEIALEHGNVAAYADKKGMSTEEAARELRYAFLGKAAERFGCDRIATAHNANDNAETVLFNLSRGSGPAGLRGIPEQRGAIVRPLLDMSREEIESWLNERSIDWVTDSSNNSDDYSRNLIRHHVLPVLKRINPACLSAFASAGELLAEDEDFIGGMADSFIAEHFDGESLPAAETKKLHRAVASRVFRKLCKKSLSRDHVESLFALLDGTELAFLDLPGERIRREKGRIYFASRETAPMGEYEVRAGESFVIAEAGLKISAEFTEYDKEVNGLFKTYCIKYESICGNVRCTARMAGDKYRPAGRNCTKTLKSLFSQANMTLQQRDLSPVFRDDKGILAAYPFPADERTLPRTGDRIIRIKIEKTTGEADR